MKEKYKYFCNSCGKHFACESPERAKLELLNDIVCPKCGTYDIYPDTAEGSHQSIKDYSEYENQIEQYFKKG